MSIGILAHLFSSVSMATASIAVLIIETLSILALCIGLLYYRHIVTSHKTFLFSLHNAEESASRRSTGVLFWVYLLSTLFLVALTSGFFIWQSLSFAP